jgi:putative membrane protein
MKRINLITLLVLAAAPAFLSAQTTGNTTGTTTTTTTTTGDNTIATSNTSSNNNNSANNNNSSTNNNNNNNNGTSAGTVDNSNNNSAGTGTATSHNSSNGGNNSNRGDNRFLSQAAAGSLHEITLGNLAETNSANADIQAFAARLVDDHTTAYNQAVELAAANGGTVPTTESRSQARANQKLTGLTGNQFDVAFINEMVRDHMKDIQTFESEATRGRDANTRAYARAQLPVLMDHLVTALEIGESLGITSFRRH